MSGHDHTRTLELSLVGIAAGQSDAFEVLYQETHAGVYAFALSILKNAHDAKDILHDTCLKVYDTAPTYTPMGQPMAFTCYPGIGNTLPRGEGGFLRSKKTGEERRNLIAQAEVRTEAKS